MALKTDTKIRSSEGPEFDCYVVTPDAQPCIAALPSGWTVTSGQIASGRASFALDSGQAGLQTVTITLTATCDTSGAQQIPSDQPGMRRFERPLSLVPKYSDIRYYTFPGGCATYQFAFAPGASPALATTVYTARSVHAPVGAGQLRPAHPRPGPCGRGAPCPG